MRAVIDTQRDWLERLYARYHDRRFVSRDPLVAVYRYDRPADREVAGLVAALLAYGNVKAMLAGIDALLDRLGPRPADAVGDPAAVRAATAGFRYRVTGEADIAALLVGAGVLRGRHGSLDDSFAAHVEPDDADVLPALARWRGAFADAAGHPLTHLLPDAAKGSACKRLLLYLRWMVRRDAIDTGQWTSVGPAMLVAPVDTHLHRVAMHLGWTRRKQITLATAREVTAALRRFDPADPLRYDFALTRPGILREPLPD